MSMPDCRLVPPPRPSSGHRLQPGLSRRLSALGGHAALGAAIAVAALGLAPAAGAAEPKAAKPAAQPKPAGSRQQLQNQAKGLALATTTVSQISEAQLATAAMVYTGQADCEFQQTVDVQPFAGYPGHFHVTYKQKRYLMVPEETSTGAVRLEDKRSGTVWLQIPSKSMLMDARRGQRLVDSCTHAPQREAAAADATQPQPGGSGLGITGLNTPPQR